MGATFMHYMGATFTIAPFHYTGAMGAIMGATYTLPPLVIRHLQLGQGTNVNVCTWHRSGTVRSSADFNTRGRQCNIAKRGSHRHIL